MGLSLLDPLLSNYVSPQGVVHLKAYQYAGVDHSLVCRMLQPLLRWLVEKIPRYVAPNLLTLIGLLSMSSAYLLLALIYAPNAAEEAPRWVYLFCAIAKFAYQLLDELDGKQARRTSSFSPLGELFDHGCDALSCFLSTATSAAALQLSAGPSFWLLNTAIFAEFYFTIWEQYNVNFLEFHHLGPNEAHLMYILVMLVTSHFGPSVWSTRVYGLEMKEALVYFVVVSAVFDFALNLRKVFLHGSKGAASLWRAIYLLLPAVMNAGLSYLWMSRSPANIFGLHPQLFTAAFGVLHSRQVGLLILSRISRDAPRPFIPELLLLPLLVLNALYLHIVPEYHSLCAWFAIVVLCYSHFALSVIRQLCLVLHIRALQIPVPTPAPQANGARRGEKTAHG